jgi:hypothetical protein
VSNSGKDNNADDEKKSNLEKKRKKLEKKDKRLQKKMKLNGGNETKVEMQNRAASLAFVGCPFCVYVQEVH